MTLSHIVRGQTSMRCAIIIVMMGAAAARLAAQQGHADERETTEDQEP